MESDPFTRKTPESDSETDWNSNGRADKTARIQKLAVSEALEPSRRREHGIPNISTERHPEAFQLQPILLSDIKPAAKQPRDNLDQLTTPDLLQVAARLSIEGRSVKQMYESNLIDYRGLHAIIREALRGGDINAIFDKYKLGEEARRGRKIEMRHDDPQETPSAPQPNKPDSHVGELISRLESAEQTQVNQQLGVTAEKPIDLASLSRKNAISAIKKKRLITIFISTAIGISIGGAITLLFIN